MERTGQRRVEKFGDDEGTRARIDGEEWGVGEGKV